MRNVYPGGLLPKRRPLFDSIRGLNFVVAQ